MSLPQKSFLSSAMERAHSASPQPHQKQKIRSTSNPHTPANASGVLPDRLNTLPQSITMSTQETPLQSPPILDATETLLHAMPAVVKARTGSVLARGFVLKTDYYPNGTSLTNQHGPILTASAGRALDLAINLGGAPNFRGGTLNVYGVAQPRISGLKAILSVLNCHPGSATHCEWFNTREEPVGVYPRKLHLCTYPLTEAFSLYWQSAVRATRRC